MYSEKKAKVSQWIFGDIGTNVRVCLLFMLICISIKVLKIINGITCDDQAKDEKWVCHSTFITACSAFGLRSNRSIFRVKSLKCHSKWQISLDALAVMKEISEKVSSVWHERNYSNWRWRWRSRVNKRLSCSHFLWSKFDSSSVNVRDELVCFW